MTLKQAILDAKRKLVMDLMKVQQNLYEAGYSHEDASTIILEAMTTAFRIKDPTFTFASIDEDMKLLIKELSPKFYASAAAYVPQS